MRVGEAKQRDVGKKRARIGPDSMDFLGLAPGDKIEITGKRRSCATAWPADEDEKTPGLIRIDGQTRKSMGVSLNDTVLVKKTIARDARSATLVPVDYSVVDAGFTDFVKRQITDRKWPLIQGDEISVVVMGNSMMFRVGKTVPDGVVLIGESTSLIISVESDAGQDTDSDGSKHGAEDGVAAYPTTRITYEEVGGLGREVKSMREIVELPLRYPELFTRLGVEAHGGVLLYGPPGCGKTLIAKALASESKANMYSISGPEIVNKYYGETEARLREIFKEAKENSPSIIFIDEIDAIAPKREDALRRRREARSGPAAGPDGRSQRARQRNRPWSHEPTRQRRTRAAETGTF